MMGNWWLRPVYGVRQIAIFQFHTSRLTCASMLSLFLALLGVQRVRSSGCRHKVLSPKTSRKSKTVKGKSRNLNWSLVSGDLYILPV